VGRFGGVALATGLDRLPVAAGAPDRWDTGRIEHAAHTAAVRAPLIRTAAFMLPASSLWALIVVGPGCSELGAGFGLLIGSLGVGAIIGGLALSWLRERIAWRRRLATATVLRLDLALSSMLSDL